MKIMTVIGARPQFVKHAAFELYLKKNQPKTKHIVVHTGQHYDAIMTADICSNFGISSPQINLNCASGDAITDLGQMIGAIANVIEAEKPTFILIYGDTNSTLAAAIAASHTGVPIIHVEAGLRSNDLTMPEERNRILTDRLSSFLITPSKAAQANLAKEGYPFFTRFRNESRQQEIVNFGDIMYDAFKHIEQKGFTKPDETGEFALMTLHRDRLFTDNVYFQNIIGFLEVLRKQIDVIFFAHPRILKTPNFQESFEKIGLLARPSCDYLVMQNYLAACKFVVTDSGGLQKEAYFHQKYCLTLRENTEWIETLINGCNRLVGSTQISMVNALEEINAKLSLGSSSTDFSNIYGDGTCSDQIYKLMAEIEGL